MPSERIQRRIDLLLDEADQALADGDWVLVRDSSSKVLALDPDNADAATYIAAAERAQATTTDSAPSPQSNETSSIEPASPASVGSQEAERRQLTVMFCDLQGSTALSQQLDPEELRDVIRGYQEVCAGAVGRFEGHIAKYLGDGLLVYFGYPQAHEDDPQRAVRAGLAILEDMTGLNTDLRADKDLELVVRIGIHTGLVVAGEMGGGDTLEELAIVGETPNIAARIEGAAKPNGVAISDVTANLVQGFFLCETMGPHELKGISEPVELFRVLQESGARSRFDVVSAAQLTPLVGREQELGLILDRWEQVKEGLGQVVLLSGEAGIGKSRLVSAVIEGFADQPYILRQIRCSPYHKNSAWHPIIDYLERSIGYRREDSPEEKLIKLEKALEGFQFPLTESVPLLAPLLSTPLSDRYPSLNLSPDEYREKTVELLIELLIEYTTGQPLALIIEDLQWADPATQGLLGFLIDQVAKIQVLVLVVVRSEFSPQWRNRAANTQITLNRLAPSLATEMVARLTGGKELPEEVISQVASKSDGVPIFVEELTRMVLESGLLREMDDHYELTGPLPSLAIPSTLQDALTARLDRLAAARELAQLGAVVGREFSYELLQALTPLEDETLRSQLQKLTDADFLYQRGLPPNATYMFKHGLIQDAAYESLLKSRRRQFHRQVAEVLEERFPETKENEPELLAHHFSEAGLVGNAVSYWQSAGERALSAYAYEGAQFHFNRALAALGCPVAEGWKGELTDETAAILFGLVQCQAALLERGQLQEARTNLNWVLDHYLETGNVERAAAVAVYPLPPIGDMGDTIRNLDRIISLVPTGSIEAGVLHARYGLVLGVEVGDYQGAKREFEQALVISRQEMDSDLEMRTLADAARVDSYNHRWTSSLEKSLRALELAQQAGNTRLELAARYRAAWALLTLGDARSAVEQSTPVLEIAETLRDRYWMVNALWINELMARLSGRWQAAAEFSERGLAIWPMDPRLLGSRILLEYETGNFDDGQELLERLIQTMDGTSPGSSLEYVNVASVIPLVSRITGDKGQLDRAARAGEVVIASTDATEGLVKDVTGGMGIIAALLGDSDTAGKHYPELLAGSGQISFASVSGDRLLGLLAGTMNNHDDAVTHFEAGIGFCRESGYLPELAWTYCDYSDALLQRGGEGDKAKAIAMLGESLAISKELGMRPLMERVLSRQETVNDGP